MSTLTDLLKQAQEIHDKKSQDYASANDPYANYHFAGKLAKLFDNPDDAGFVGRIGEKLYRLANLENNKKEPLNESIEDTEIDILTITALWIASRRDGRLKEARNEILPGQLVEGFVCKICKYIVPYGRFHICGE